MVSTWVEWLKGSLLLNTLLEVLDVGSPSRCSAPPRNVLGKQSWAPPRTCSHTLWGGALWLIPDPCTLSCVGPHGIDARVSVITLDRGAQLCICRLVTDLHSLPSLLFVPIPFCSFLQYCSLSYRWSVNNIFRTVTSKERHFKKATCFIFFVKENSQDLLPAWRKEISGVDQEDRSLVWFLWPVLLETCIQSNLFFSDTVTPHLS